MIKYSKQLQYCLIIGVFCLCLIGVSIASEDEFSTLHKLKFFKDIDANNDNFIDILELKSIYPLLEDYEVNVL